MFSIKVKIFILLSIGIVTIGINYSIPFVFAADDINTSQNSIFEKHGKLSFYFQSIETRSLLQLIAKSSGLNFIISDAVKGTITLNLKDVTWEQALNIVLKTQGLISRRIGNAVYISTLEEIAGTEAKQMQYTEQLSNLSPLVSTIVNLKYTNAADLANMLKGSQSILLSARGQVGVDLRTNSIVIRDIQSNLGELVKTIRILDIPAKQVLIEARIVNIDSIFEEQIGVRFGVSESRHMSGTFEGANQIAQGLGPAFVKPPTERLNFNIPASVLFDGSRPGSVALALAHLGPMLLDLELSALEAERHARLIARPRVVTSNQQKALIQTGEEIP